MSTSFAALNQIKELRCDFPFKRPARGSLVHQVCGGKKKKKRKETGSSSQRDERTVSEEDVHRVITASSLFFLTLLHQNITFSFWATAQGVKNHFHSQA